MKLTLGTDPKARKDTPMLAGLKGYFLAALAGVARHSWRSNKTHNGDEPMHWARGKSMDHGECVDRHLSDCEEMRMHIERSNAEGIEAHQTVAEYLQECDALAWRALAYSQIAYEKYGGAPMSFNSRVTPPADVHVPLQCEFTVGKGAYRCELSRGHTGPCGALSAPPVPVGTLIDLSHEIPPAEGNRLVYPPVRGVSGPYPCLWQSKGGEWNWETDAAMIRGYTTEAEARAGYWADYDAG